MSRTRIGERERINFYFDKNLLEALKKLAALKGTTYSELIRVGMREYVVREGSAAISAGKIIQEVQR